MAAVDVLPVGVRPGSAPTRDVSGGPARLLSSRPRLSSMAFVIIPGGRMPGSVLRGGPVIIVGRLLFLRKHNQPF